MSVRVPPEKPVPAELVADAQQEGHDVVASISPPPIEAQIVSQALSAEKPGLPPEAKRNLIARGWSGVWSVFDWLFGIVSLVLGLAVLATIPILQFLSLGYLLELSGRVSRSGRLRDGFVGIEKIRRVGSIAISTWLLLWPARLVSDLAYSSYLINGEDHRITRAWRVGSILLAILLFAHILWAWYRGGRFRHFLWPAPVRLLKEVFQGNMYQTASKACIEFVQSLRLPYYFWLGLRGFVGAVIWLVIPVTIMALSGRAKTEVTGLAFAFFGGLLFSIVLLYLPFLQAHFAAENRFKAMFEVGKVRQQFKRAPIAYFVALVFTLVLAVPLYLLKAELIPREAAWLPALVFIVFILPARFLSGWAHGRARKRTEKRFFGSRWAAWLAGLPVIATYTLIVFITQYTSWYGGFSLYEQHAFLLPVPFLGF